jgi:hypothetical protein
MPVRYWLYIVSSVFSGMYNPVSVPKIHQGLQLIANPPLILFRIKYESTVTAGSK